MAMVAAIFVAASVTVPPAAVACAFFLPRFVFPISIRFQRHFYTLNIYIVSCDAAIRSDSIQIAIGLFQSHWHGLMPVFVLIRIKRFWEGQSQRDGNCYDYVLKLVFFSSLICTMPSSSSSAVLFFFGRAVSLMVQSHHRLTIKINKCQSGICTQKLDSFPWNERFAFGPSFFHLYLRPLLTLSHGDHIGH